ncbi:MAG: CBS domain-containing protein, partial [Anaerolineales bacterium]|nr:CBS domain-containing protein [Anaerolineales bacterium]
MTHENADFDAVASMWGAHRLYPDAQPLLPRRINRNVDQFLTLYWDTFRYMRPNEWKRRRVDSVILVDTQGLNSVRGVVPRPVVFVIDHHVDHKHHDLWSYEVESVGATTTILVEKIQQSGLLLSQKEATLFLLGVHEDTGSLTYDTTTSRDVLAAAWLVEQGAMLSVVRRFLNVPLTPAQRDLYDQLQTAVKWLDVHGQTVVVAATTAPEGFQEEISSVVHRLRDAMALNGLIVLVQIGPDVQVIARSDSKRIDVAQVARALGGGGHSRAAAALVPKSSLPDVVARVMSLISTAVSPMVKVSQLMSYGVQTIAADSLVARAAAMMQQTGHEGYPVVDNTTQRLVGLLTRRAVDRAMSHELESLPVRRIMKAGVVTVRPSDSIDRLQQLMLTEGWGQIPVLSETAEADDCLPIGVVTRTDLLNHIFQPVTETAVPNMRQLLAEQLDAALWHMVLVISRVAAELDMPLYFVGGLVRDLLLGQPAKDLDMVVEGDAIRLARKLEAVYGGQVHAHSRFGTAKWLLETAVWQAIAAAHPEAAAACQSPPVLPSIDFVTARTEFYTEPTALPTVSQGSIKLDLHRRDFAINTLAVRLDGAHLGELLDFYGGQRDLAQGVIRVLHSLSFVDDPTRILRALRLEQRLGFTLEPRTAELLHNSLQLLDKVTGSRVRHELELTLQEPEPVAVMNRYEEIGLLRYIYPGLFWRADTAVTFAQIRTLLQDETWRQALNGSGLVFPYFAAWMLTLPVGTQDGTLEWLMVRKSTRQDVVACRRG